MTNIKALKIVNLLLGIDFIIVALTAVLNDWIQAAGYYFISHAIPGFVLLLLVFLHLLLNRNWVKNTYFKKRTSN